MLHPRLASGRLKALLGQFPVVTVAGARQSGKSTLARIALPTFTHLDLEDPRDLDRISADPLLVLVENRRIALDEAQRLPDLFPIIRSFIDRKPAHRIVLLGSASPHLVRGVSESLTGRVGFLDLGGVSIFEHPMEALWIEGGFPRLHWSRPRARPAEWFPSFLRTTLERDVPLLGFQIPPRRLHDLLVMIAHSQGAPCNLSEIGGSLGINYHSVARAIDILEGIFLLRRLRPWHANVGKRVVKAPKIYVRDSGLLHWLLGIPHQRRALLAHPKAGSSFETFCIEQILTHARLVDPSAEGYYWRTHGGPETDLLLQLRGRLHPIEIKMGLGVPDLRGLQTCMADLSLDRGWVVSLASGETKLRSNIVACDLPTLLRKLRLVPVR